MFLYVTKKISKRDLQGRDRYTYIREVMREACKEDID